MDDLQRELKFNTLDELVEKMNREAKGAVDFLRANPSSGDVQHAIRAFQSWNYKQFQFWDDIFRFVEEEVTGEFPKRYI